MGGPQTAEIPPLHAAGKTLADRGAGDVDELTDDKMVGLDLGADRDQRILAHAKFGKLALRLDLGERELAALGLRHVDGLAGARAELQRDVSVVLGRAMAQHLTIAQLQHGHGDMLAGLGKDPRHPDLLCDHSGAHLRASCSFCPPRADLKSKPLELDLDVDTGGQIELHESIDGLRGRVDNVEKALVGAHLELLTALLVDMRRTVDGELLDAGRQRNGSANLRTGALRRVHDLTRRRIEDSMVERLEAYANILAVHCRAFFGEWRVASSENNRSPLTIPYSRSLLDDGSDNARADGAAALADRKAQLLLHRDRHDQVHFHRDVVARHHHLGAFRQVHDTGHVGGAEVELRTVVGEERGMASALFLGEDVSLGLELGVRLDRTRLAQHLAALDLLALGTAEQRTDVVARLALVEQLAEHLDAGDRGLLGVAQADDLDFVADLDDAALDT